MKYPIKFFILVIFYIQSTANCQVETKTINLPLVKPQNQYLAAIIDTIFISEQKCDYYNDSLLLGISIRISEDSTTLSLQFETQDSKAIMLGIDPLTYFYYKKHLCLIYFNLSNELFAVQDSNKTFYYEERKDYMEDDSFSMWTYYYHDKVFYFNQYYSYCNK